MKVKNFAKRQEIKHAADPFKVVVILFVGCCASFFGAELVSDFLGTKHQFHLQWSITLSTMTVPAH